MAYNHLHPPEGQSSQAKPEEKKEESSIVSSAYERLKKKLKFM
jgi:hypothetical protein